MEFHPDQNQENKGVVLLVVIKLMNFSASDFENVFIFFPWIVAEAAEAKFKEVMGSYEAIKKERKDMN